MNILIRLMWVGFLAAALPLGLRADMEGMEEVKTTDHASAAFEDGRQLTLRMDPDHATVGNMVTLQGGFTQGGKAVKDVRVELAFHHIEDDVDNYRTSFIARDGSFTLRHHFFDGAPHKVILKVSPVEPGAWAPRELAMDINVVAIQPPTPVVMRTLLMLVAVAAGGMVLGFMAGKGGRGR